MHSIVAGEGQKKGVAILRRIHYGRKLSGVEDRYSLFLGVVYGILSCIPVILYNMLLGSTVR